MTVFACFETSKITRCKLLEKKACQNKVKKCIYKYVAV